MLKIGYSSIPEIQPTGYLRFLLMLFTVVLPTIVGVYVYKRITNQIKDYDIPE